MQRNRIFLFLLILFSMVSLAACGRNKVVCPTEAESSGQKLPLAELIETTSPISPSKPVSVEIQGKKMQVDKLVDYPLCNDNWRGTVYVSCEARVAEAELDANSNPLFLKGCQLDIAPNTVVYVAAHNDAAYYKGCSCHTGEVVQP